MLVPYCDVHLQTAAPLTAYCYTINFNVLAQTQATHSKCSNLIFCIYLDNVISKRYSECFNVQDWFRVDKSVVSGNVTLQICYDLRLKFELFWRYLDYKYYTPLCRETSTPAIRPAPAAPVPGGVPTPFAAAPLPYTSAPKPFVNSAASVSPVSKPLNRVPSPVVFPPPLPTSQDFNFQLTAKPHAQFRPAEPGAFDEHDEELTAIANQVTTPRWWFQ